MKKTIFSIISAFLILLCAAGCSADMDNARLQGQNNGNADINQLYDRGREDYPGQSYANRIGTLIPQGDRAGGNGGTAGNAADGPDGRNNMPNGAAEGIIADVAGNTPRNTTGTTGTQLSAGNRLPANGSGIVLRSIRTPVRRGETGSLSIQGRADTQYTITAVYKNSSGVVTTTVVRQAGTDGIVDLSWNVGRDTVPDTYGIMITGGGEQLAASYTVTE